jgi:hypothetical protein
MKIYIVCTDNVTGGTECLHQLGSAIQHQGFQIYMHILNESSKSSTRQSFKEFNLEYVEHIPDTIESYIIFPENSTILSKAYKKAYKIIFWLSVDNFFPKKGTSKIRDFVARYNLRRKRLCLSEMKNFIHLSQSYYSTSFLNKHNLNSHLIGDYLNDDFFLNAENAIKENIKLNQVCYNPAKGKKYVDYLINKFPEIKFIPIVDMSREEVIKTLARSKIYLDLGLHPGKDRIPREATILGACIATSRFGSARNTIDVPIPDTYKFDVNKTSLNKIPILIQKVFNNHELEFKKFTTYKNIIKNEKKYFNERVAIWLKGIS